MLFGCVPQLMLGVPEQALNILHEAIETVLAHGSVMDKGRALMLMARCQLAAAGFSSDAPSHPGNRRHPHTGPCLSQGSYGHGKLGKLMEITNALSRPLKC